MAQGNPVSDKPRRRAVAYLLGGLLLAGCDGEKLCQQCERPPKPAQTVRVEVDWKKLADAFKDAGIVGGKGATVSADTVNVTVDSDHPNRPADGPNAPPVAQKDVTVAGWAELVGALDALKPLQTAAQSAHYTYNIPHSTFAFRFSSPWFNADQRSLLTSYVVFPVEAKLTEWAQRVDRQPLGERSRCKTDKPASVCPETTFYGQVMGPFLKGLSQCATDDKKVELQLHGFASESGLREGEEHSVLDQRYDSYIAALQHCYGDRAPGERNSASNKFNLLIADERAVNTAAMLKELIPNGAKNAFDIKEVPWCSHRSMVYERKLADGGDPAKALMNRRVEVRVAALPGCVNVEPDNRIPTQRPRAPS